MRIEQRGTENTWIMTKAELRAIVAVASTDPARANLTVVCFDARNRAVAATDGHRLTRCRVSAELADAEPALVPAASLAEIAKRAKKRDEISICPHDLSATVTITSSDGTAFTSEIALVTTKFPPLDQVVPRDPDGRKASAAVGLDAEYLPAIVDLQRAAGAKSVRLHVGSQHDPIVFVAENFEHGNIWEHVLMPFRL